MASTAPWRCPARRPSASRRALWQVCCRPAFEPCVRALCVQRRCGRAGAHPSAVSRTRTVAPPPVRAPKGGANPLSSVSDRMKGLWALRVTRPIGPLWEPNALVGAITRNPGRSGGLLSPGPDGPSSVGRFRHSNSFSPSSAHEARSADVISPFKISENLFFFWINFQKFLKYGFNL
jgi:hypothetical protein